MRLEISKPKLCGKKHYRYSEDITAAEKLAHLTEERHRKTNYSASRLRRMPKNMDKLGGWNGERYEAKFHATSYSHHHCSLLFLGGEDSASSTLSLYLQGPPLCLQTACSFPLGGGEMVLPISRILPLSPICLDFSFYVFRLPLSVSRLIFLSPLLLALYSLSCSLLLPKMLPPCLQAALPLSLGCSLALLRFPYSLQLSLATSVHVLNLLLNPFMPMSHFRAA